MMQGEVVWFKNTYGFIRSSTTGDEFFCYHSAIEMDGYKTLLQGQKVEFEVGVGPKGKLQVEYVKVVR